MDTYAKVYKLLDPLIKKEPTLLFSALQKSHPELAKKITYWSFNARKNKFFPKKGKAAQKTAKVVNSKAVKPVKGKKVSVAKIKAAIGKIVPSTKKFKEYFVVGQILTKNPNTIYSHLIKAKKITMCDANYYQFRRKFCALLDLEITAREVNSHAGRSNGKNGKFTGSPAFVRKKSQLYTVLYEKEVNGFGEPAKALLADFIETVNREKALPIMEMVEVISPKKVIEVRSLR